MSISEIFDSFGNRLGGLIIAILITATIYGGAAGSIYFFARILDRFNKNHQLSDKIDRSSFLSLLFYGGGLALFILGAYFAGEILLWLFG